MIKIDEVKIGVIGLGYVGLPLAVEFASKFPTVGFDINAARIKELNSGTDSTLEVSDEKLKEAFGSRNFVVTDDLNKMSDVNFFIVTVPTPTDKHNRPDLTPLIKASETVAKCIKKGDIVVYESTVYPGVTEDECIPIIEKITNLKFNQDFFAGYSPERINPGDKEHTVTKILKVTSGSSPESADLINRVYQKVIVAGTFLASSIKVAEAAKVIENSQRDINIAFVNELAKIFNLIDIDTHEVLAAAGTKWNFLPFKPGLVGGHCIGVDPYYLAQKAEELGYHPEIILSGRRLNDSMGKYVAQSIVKELIRRGRRVGQAKILLLGITFKENCPDIRNTRVIDIIHELGEYGCEVDIYDPWANENEVSHEYNLKIISKENLRKEGYKVVVHAVSHKDFADLDYSSLKDEKGFVYDVKGTLPKNIADVKL